VPHSENEWISKNHFQPGGLAALEWTGSVRAVRDTLVADYFAPITNTTFRVAYCPPIAVSLILLAPSVSYCKRTLWCCAQLWPYVRMGSSHILEQLRPLHSSAGDLVSYSQSIGSQGSISTRHFVYHNRRCYSHKIRYLIIWHTLFKYLYI